MERPTFQICATKLKYYIYINAIPFCTVELASVVWCVRQCINSEVRSITLVLATAIRGEFGGENR